MEPLTPALYRRLAAEVETNLNQHIIDTWFPRALDKTTGGFYQNFDEDWSLGTAGGRGIVYQSRLTWVASEMALRYPQKRNTFVEYARHGCRFLETRLWDADDGGMFWAINENGKPISDGEKHTYGLAFSIYALATAYRATRDNDARELAKKQFLWLESHAHDRVNGGYYEPLTRAGKPILSGETGQNDFIGTAYGRKSMNTHIHVLEALTALFKIWPDPQVMNRLKEVFLIVRDRIAASDGYLHMYLTPDWKPVSDEDSYGHDIETAFLLLEAASALQLEKDVRTLTISRRLVDHTIKFAWDDARGGFYDSGPVDGTATNRLKIWWTQAEGWNALLQMHERFGKESPKYWQYFTRQWAFIQEHQVDKKNHGWLGTVSEEGKPFPGQAKSDMWTDPYHQGRAAMHVSETLRHLADKK